MREKLSMAERAVLEKLFRMDEGNVLNFDMEDIKFFFRNDMGVDIYDDKYDIPNSSWGDRAARVKNFMEQSSPKAVASLIEKLINCIKSGINAGIYTEEEYPAHLIERANGIKNRLLGSEESVSITTTPKEFHFDDIANILENLEKLNLDPALHKCITRRINEMHTCMENKCYLSTVILCGSCMEGILSDFASKNNFTSHPAAPDKKTENWHLADLIKIAVDTNAIKNDVNQHATGVRGYRNFVHPRREIKDDVNIDKNRAEIAVKALKLLIDELSQHKN